MRGYTGQRHRHGADNNGRYSRGGTRKEKGEPELIILISPFYNP
jgi:hypothetical protein